MTGWETVELGGAEAVRHLMRCDGCGQELGYTQADCAHGQFFCPCCGLGPTRIGELAGRSLPDRIREDGTPEWDSDLEPPL